MFNATHFHRKFMLRLWLHRLRILSFVAVALLLWGDVGHWERLGWGIYMWVTDAFGGGGGGGF